MNVTGIVGLVQRLVLSGVIALVMVVPVTLDVEAGEPKEILRKTLSHSHTIEILKLVKQGWRIVLHDHATNTYDCGNYVYRRYSFRYVLQNKSNETMICGLNSSLKVSGCNEVYEFYCYK